MQELLGGSDNIFKYMATVGILLVGISILYPLEKKNEIDIKRNELISILKIDSLENEFVISDINNILTQNNKDFDAARELRIKIDNESDKNKIKLLTKELNNIVNSKKQIFDLYTKKHQQRLKNSILLKYKTKEISLLEEQSKSFKTYYSWAFWIGLPMSLIGITLWFAQQTYWKRKD